MAAKGKGKAGPPLAVGKAPPCLAAGKGKAKGDPKPRAEDVEAVHAACQFDDEAALATLLQRPPDSYARRGLTPLHTAAANGSCRAARLLLAGRANVDATNSFKETGLHLATAGAQPEVLRLLLSARASLDLEDRWGRTALRVARENGASAVEALLRDVGAPDAGPESTEPCRLSAEQAARQQALAKEMIARLRDRPAAVVEPEVKHIFAPSAGAATSSSTGRDAALVGRRPLSKHVEYPGDPLAVAALLTDEADPADPAGRDAFGLSALHKFAAWNKVDLMELLLPLLGEDDVNAVGGDEGFTALHHAVSMGAADAARSLLEEPRVRRDVRDRAGRTPRDVAEAAPGLERLVALFDAAVPICPPLAA